MADMFTQAPALDLPDRYTDRGPIAVGGMGEVRRVWDNLLSHTVAMKISLPSIAAHSALRQRFLDEARLTARLSHPSIIPVHDLGTLSDGRLFFTMAEVEGRTLERHLQDHDHSASALPPRWMFDVFVLSLIHI